MVEKLVRMYLLLALFMPLACLAEELAVEPDALGERLAVGDLVFIRVSALPFQKVAETTKSWTNHVGVVVDVSGKEPMIAESTFPLSRETDWSHFVARSERGRVAVARLAAGLDAEQGLRLRKAAVARYGIHYDTGFDLYSRGQFCSRFAREVLEDAAGVELGRVENFGALLAGNPDVDLTFWKMWFLGSIPWRRETVTPASLLEDARLQTLFDGRAMSHVPHKGDQS